MGNTSRNSFNNKCTSVQGQISMPPTLGVYIHCFWQFSRSLPKIIWPYLATFAAEVQHPARSLSMWLAPWTGNMNQILRRDWLTERATWRYGLAVRNYPLCEQCSFFSASLFDQEFWILASFLFCVFLDLDSVSDHKQEKNRTWQIPSHLDPAHACSITEIYKLTH